MIAVTVAAMAVVGGGVYFYQQHQARQAVVLAPAAPPPPAPSATDQLAQGLAGLFGGIQAGASLWNNRQQLFGVL
jgi:hypothetical protein